MRRVVSLSASRAFMAVMMSVPIRSLIVAMQFTSSA